MQIDTLATTLTATQIGLERLVDKPNTMINSSEELKTHYGRLAEQERTQASARIIAVIEREEEPARTAVQLVKQEEAHLREIHFSLDGIVLGLFVQEGLSSHGFVGTLTGRKRSAQGRNSRTVDRKFNSWARVLQLRWPDIN